MGNTGRLRNLYPTATLMTDTHRPGSASHPCCVLCSGGVDSAVLLSEFLATHTHVTPIYVQCGLRWEKAEMFWLQRYLDAVRTPALQPVKIIALPVADIYGTHWSMTGPAVPPANSPDTDVHLPGRNILLLSKVAVYCAQKGIETIATGSLAGNPFPDATPDFWKSFSDLLSRALNTSITISTPFAGLTKHDVMRRGAHLPLQYTFSCLQPSGLEHCQHCNKCEERRKAFQKAGIFFPKT